jgi:hypothetical protein
VFVLRPDIWPAPHQYFVVPGQKIRAPRVAAPCLVQATFATTSIPPPPPTTIRLQNGNPFAWLASLAAVEAMFETKIDGIVQKVA